ncbi:MAG: PAS domain-containing protein, partial [Acetobacteraceae bacterium]
MATTRPAPRLAGLLPAGALLAGAAIVAAVGIALHAELKAEVSGAERRATALAESAVEAVSRRLEAIDYALSAIAAQVDPARLGQQQHREDLHRLARQALSISSEAIAFVVIDGRGVTVATSRVSPERMAPTTLAASPAFLAAARDYRPSLSVSERFVGGAEAAADLPVVAVSRSVLDGEGLIGAVVAAILPADGSGALLPGIAVPSDVAVLLTLTDGTPIGRLPDWRETPSLQDSLAAVPGAILSVRPARGGTTAVIVAYDRRTILADWARMAVPIGAAALALALALVLLAQRLARSLRQLEAAAADLGAREQEMRRIADALGIGLWARRSPQARTEYFGDFVERLTGKPRSLLEARPNVWREEVVVEEDRETLKSSYRSSDLTRGWHHTYRIIGADGSVRWIEDKAIQLAAPGGDPGPVYGAVTDITEIRAARETILRQATQLADAARMAKLCFWRLPKD